MNNHSGEEEPLKHVERPSQTRSEMRHHKNHAPVKDDKSRSDQITPVRRREVESSSQKISKKDAKSKGSTKIWASLIIIAILIIALVPIINNQMHKSNTNLAEKKVESSKISSKSHKSAKKVSKKAIKKSTPSEQKSSTSNTQTSQNYQAVNNEYSQSTNSGQAATSNDYSQQASTQNNSQSNNSYQVQTGDSLSKIASDNNTTVEKLKSLNGLSDDTLNPGQSIKLK